MKKYRKRPVVIEAHEVTDTMDIIHMVKYMNINEGDAQYVYNSKGDVVGGLIRTLEGNMRFGVGDYIIRGVQGEYYACKPDIFKETYEEV